MKTTEVWRQSDTLPEYLVSSLGRMMRIPYRGEMPNGGERWYGGEPHQGQWAKEEERYVHQFGGVTYKVHQLICEAFHGSQPFPDAVVRHIDENPLNNRASNLAWATQKENLNAPGFIEYCKGRTGLNNPFIKGRKMKEGKL